MKLILGIALFIFVIFIMIGLVCACILASWCDKR